MTNPIITFIESGDTVDSSVAQQIARGEIRVIYQSTADGTWCEYIPSHDYAKNEEIK